MTILPTAERRSLKPDSVRTFPRPHTLNVEIEFTNVCNAACSACPRSDMPEHGMMRPETLRRILDLYPERSNGELPRVTVAGGGEPLLNRHAMSLLEMIVSRGFETHLITNASAVTAANAKLLASLGLRSISVSFWGIQKSDYERTMHLPFESTLAKVEGLAAVLGETSTDLGIIWVRTPEIRSSDADVKAFWDERNIAVDLEDTKAWNRGGLLDASAVSGAGGNLPDPDRHIWCADLYFSDSFNWRGDLLLCCCNYFTKNQIRLARAADGTEEIAASKQRVLESRPLPQMCSTCLLPRAQRSRFLVGDAFQRLSRSEERELTAFDQPLAGGQTASGVMEMSNDIGGRSGSVGRSVGPRG